MAQRRRLLIGVVFGVLFWCSLSRAKLGSLDAVPAATLLLPYFEVDLDNADGVTTIFSVNNLSADPALALVTLWSDYSVPTRGFHIYLTGYDVTVINLRNVFNGQLPQTTPTLNEPGPFSGPNVEFPGCETLLPPAFTPAEIEALRALHTGHADPMSGQCSGKDHGDNVARGFVTVDVVNLCSTSLPGTAGYFLSGGLGVAGVRNVLWGDFVLLDRLNNFANGDNLVHIEADAFDPLVTTPGNYTFYSAATAGLASDNREALPATWIAPFESNRTKFVVWRDPGIPIAPFTCGEIPDPFPMTQLEQAAYDWTGFSFLPGAAPPECPDDQNGGCLPLFPFDASVTRAPVNRQTTHSDVLGQPFKSGTFLLNFGATTGAPHDPVKQSFLYILDSIDNLGLFETGYAALPLNNAGTMRTGKSHGQTPDPARPDSGEGSP